MPDDRTGDGALAGGGSRPVRILAVGNDPRSFHALRRLAPAEGGAITVVPDPPAAIRAMRREPWNLLIVPLDQRFGESEWWSDALRGVRSPPRVIALVPAPSLALDATRAGVSECLPVPLHREHLADLLRRVREAEADDVVPLPEVVSPTGGIVSGSPAMLPVFRAIAQVAPTAANVLITGESGTGKELAARAIHQLSPRAGGPFLALHCAAIPEQLLESELFGHEKGAFTGAATTRVGRLERASGGTLFLDEIGDMSLPMQGNVLRAIQEQEIERVGGPEVIRVDVRLIAAMHSDPEALVRDGRLRGDLYHRLAVMTIRLPRLVDRGDDVRLLTAYLSRTISQRYGRRIVGISRRALRLLEERDWPGNIRELRNVIERAVVIAEGEVLGVEQLPAEWAGGSPASPLPGAPATLREVEIAHVGRVLARVNGHIGEAARILGVHRNTLSRKLREYGL